MKRALLTVCMLTLVSPATFAVEPSEMDLAKELAEALGFEAMLTGLKAQSEQAAQQQIGMVLDQFKKSFPDAPEEFMREMSEAANLFTKKVVGAWDPAEASRIYATALAETLTEEQLQVSIRHYRAPEGKKELAAINEAAGKLNAYVTESILKATDQATQEFVAKIREMGEKARRKRASGGQN